MQDQLLGILSDTSDLVGTLLIAYAALSVHHRFRHEHKVDEEVFKAMSTEIRLGVLGVILIIIGFVLGVLARTV